MEANVQQKSLKARVQRFGSFLSEWSCQILGPLLLGV